MEVEGAIEDERKRKGQWVLTLFNSNQRPPVSQLPLPGPGLRRVRQRLGAHPVHGARRPALQLRGFGQAGEAAQRVELCAPGRQPHQRRADPLGDARLRPRRAHGAQQLREVRPRQLAPRRVLRVCELPEDLHQRRLRAAGGCNRGVAQDAQDPAPGQGVLPARVAQSLHQRGQDSLVEVEGGEHLEEALQQAVRQGGYFCERGEGRGKSVGNSGCFSREW